MKSLLSIGLLLLVLTSGAKAEQVPELTLFLEKEMAAEDQAVAQCSHPSHEPGSTQTQIDDEWYFRIFMLRARAQFGFEIPGFAKLQVIPEAQFVWQREWPEGWTAYRP